MGAQALGVKVVGALAQLIVAALLLKSDFGVAATALAVAAFADLAQVLGVRTVLVQKASRSRAWAGAAFWLCLWIGVAAGLLLAMAAWPIAWLFSEPRLVPLLLVSAAGLPFSACIIPALSVMQTELRFRDLAAIDAGRALLGAALLVCFAAVGLGPLSLILPRVLIAALTCPVAMRIARLHPAGRVDRRRLRLLMRASLVLSIGNFALLLTSQADYLVLSAFVSVDELGAYYFAFGLSTQALVLVAQALSTVLLPSLAHLRADSVRQVRAYVRAARLITLTGVPVCVLQAAVAGPTLRLLYADKWDEAIPLLQMLSVAMAFRMSGFTAGTLMKAQGRYGLLTAINVLYGVIFTVLVFFAAASGGTTAVAAVVPGFYLVVGVMHLFLAVRPGGQGFRDTAGVCVLPLFLAGISFGLATTLTQQMGAKVELHPLLQIVGIMLLGGFLYLAGLKLVAPVRFHEIRAAFARH